MTLGTVAVVAVLALIVGAIIYRWVKAKKAGINPHCSGCSSSGSCSAMKEHKDSTQTPSCHS